MADAPRFHAYFEKIEERSVFTMSRKSWEKAQSQRGESLELDITATPLRRVASEASILAARAIGSSSSPSEIEIFRFDPKDGPTPINVDRYTVFEDMLSHRSFNEIVTGGSTTFNENLKQYLAENVFIVKQDPGDDHWLPELPASVHTVFRST